MKIVDVKATNLAPLRDSTDPTYGKNNTIVQVCTDEGIEGIGQIDSSPAAKFIVEEHLKPLLLGEDPLEVERLWTMMYRKNDWAFGFRGLGIHSMAGVDIALWDVAGKKLGVPVWKLLGGRYRDKVIPYASAAFKGNLEKLAKEASFYASQGFKAVKFGWQPFARESLEKDIEMVKTIRDAVGDDVKLIVDAGRPWEWNASRAITTIKRIEKYDIFFLEEPLPPDDIDGYVQISAAVDTPVSGGETLSTIQEFKQLILRRATDILQPDPCRVGLTQWKRIAAMAAESNIFCIGHDWSTGINIAAQIQLVASIPNGLYVEYYRPTTHEHTEGSGWAGDVAFDTALMDELLTEPFELKDGYFDVPSKPGLGISLNEKTLAKYGR
jgi:L-alanine-DL-glutamate epimerase-like enolase superfamily enzyme